MNLYTDTVLALLNLFLVCQCGMEQMKVNLVDTISSHSTNVSTRTQLTKLQTLSVGQGEFVRQKLSF